MVKTIEGNFIAKGKKFGIIASRFNDFITKELISGCVDTLVRHRADEEHHIDLGAWRIRDPARFRKDVQV